MRDQNDNGGEFGTNPTFIRKAIVEVNIYLNETCKINPIFYKETISFQIFHLNTF